MRVAPLYLNLGALLSCCLNGGSDIPMMTDKAFFEQVWKLVSPRLEDKPRALEWLAMNTRPLQVQLRVC